MCGKGVKTVHGADTTTVDLTGLKPATTYTVTVQAIIKDKEPLTGDPRDAKTSEFNIKY